MGLFDRFTSDTPDDVSERGTSHTTSDDYKAESYTDEDLPEEIRVTFADRWPTGKPIDEYELVYATADELADPILLRSDSNLFIPDGTKLMLYDDLIAVDMEERTYLTCYAHLITPEVASLLDEDRGLELPEPFEGRYIAPREPDSGEIRLMNVLIDSIHNYES